MAKFIPADPFDLVIFGGTGDLAKRKLLPALFHRDVDGQLGEGSRIIASSRKDLAREEFVAMVEEALRQHLPEDKFDAETWKRFSARLHHHRQDVTSNEGWQPLIDLRSEKPGHICVFYLATLPSLYGPAYPGASAAGVAAGALEFEAVGRAQPTNRMSPSGRRTRRTRAVNCVACPSSDCSVTSCVVTSFSSRFWRT